LIAGNARIRIQRVLFAVMYLRAMHDLLKSSRCNAQQEACDEEEDLNADSPLTVESLNLEHLNGIDSQYHYDGDNRLTWVSYPVNTGNNVTTVYGLPAESGDVSGNVAGRVKSVNYGVGGKDFKYDDIAGNKSE
jgi:hypothetical protein